jgi:GNAT superfamily N-acetyltransferase
MRLVSLSGGLDSVLAALLTLRDGGGVHLHYANCGQPSCPRGAAEADAVALVVRWLAQHFSFSFSTSVMPPSLFDRSTPYGGLHHVRTVAGWVGGVFADRGADVESVARGGEREENVRHARGLAVANRHWGDAWRLRGLAPPPVVFPNERFQTKVRALKELPDALRMVSTSCLWPDVRGGRAWACGACATCLERRRAGIGLTPAGLALRTLEERQAWVDEHSLRGALRYEYATRRAVPDDERAVRDACAAAVGPKDYVARLLPRILDDGVVVTASGWPVAAAFVDRCPDGQAWYWGVRTHRGFQRLGLSRRLWQEAVALARSRGATVMRGWTATTNARAQAMDDGNGMARVGRFTDDQVPRARAEEARRLWPNATYVYYEATL